MLYLIYPAIQFIFPLNIVIIETPFMMDPSFIHGRLRFILLLFSDVLQKILKLILLLLYLIHLLLISPFIILLPLAFLWGRFKWQRIWIQHELHNKYQTDIFKSQMNNPKVIVFFDVNKGKTKLGRIKMQLWHEKLPQTCENFRKLCTGQYIKNGKPTGFKQTFLEKSTFESIRGGAYINEKSGQSIYGQNFKQKTDSQDVASLDGTPWLISMIKEDDGKYSSLFEISAKWSKENKNLIPFGHIVEQSSIRVMEKVIQYENEKQTQKKQILITECGEM